MSYEPETRTCVGSDDDVDRRSHASRFLQSWVDAFNQADAEALADFYAEDAINHQVAEAPVHGRAAI
jgi:ketosteroid isomerase-like protein